MAITITISVAQYRAALAGNQPYPPFDTVILEDSATAIQGLSTSELSTLADLNVDRLHATPAQGEVNGALTLSLGQLYAISIPSRVLTGDTLKITATAAEITNAFADPNFENLVGIHSVDLLEATDGGTISLSIYSAMIFLAEKNVAFSGNTTAKAKITYGFGQAGDPQVIAKIISNGIDTFELSGPTEITVAQASAFLGTSATFSGSGTLKVADTGANIAALYPHEISALIAKGVDTFETAGPTYVSLAQLEAFGSALSSLYLYLKETGSNITALSVEQIGALVARGVKSISADGSNPSDNEFFLTVEKLSALGTISLQGDDVITLTGTADYFKARTASDLQALALRGIDKMKANGEVVLTLAEARLLLGSSPAYTDTVVTVQGTTDDFKGLLSNTITGLANKGVTKFDVTTGALKLGITEALAFAATGISLAAGDTFQVTGTGAALAGLDSAQFNALRAKGATFDATDDLISLTAAKLNMFGGYLTAGDQITLADTGAMIASTDIADLDEKGVAAINATDDMLTLSTAQYNALAASVALTRSDVITLTGTAEFFQTRTPEQLQALAARGIDKMKAGSEVELTVDQAKALAGSALAYSDDSAVRLTASAAAFDTLTASEITALGRKGVDSLDLTGGRLHLTVEKAAAFAGSGIAIAVGDSVDLSDSGQNIAALSAAQIAALSSQGIASIDATDDRLALTVSQFDSLGGVALTTGDAVSLSDNGQTIATLSAAQIASLAGKGLDSLDASDDLLALSIGQLNALGTVSLTSSDTVALLDTGSRLAALSADQIGALAGKGVDALDVSDNAVTLSAAQFKALGSMSLTGSDMVTLSDTGSGLGALTVDQIAAFAAKGVDVLDASDNSVALSAAQFNALGTLAFAAGDRLSINGTAGIDIVAGRAGDEDIIGMAGSDRLSGGGGNDKIWGGRGKDELSGGAGQDLFVFDTKPAKADLDTITDFNVADDTIHLAKKAFTKIAKKGALSGKAFWAGTKAHDADDRIVYNKKTGALYYDDDGSGAHAMVQIAKLSKNLKLTAKDFFVV